MDTENQAVFYQSPFEKTFFLDWHSQGTEKNELTVSKDKEFKTVVLTTPNIKAKVLVKDLPAGVYFWKVSGLDGAGSTVTAPERTFIVQYLEKLTIVEPTEGMKFDVEVKGDTAAHGNQ